MSQIHTVRMPDIGEGVVEGEVIEWLKAVGKEVKQDEPIVVVMTDKATVELPAPRPGKLSRQYYQPGQMAQRDKPLYDLEYEGVSKEEAPAPSAEEPPKPINREAPQKTSTRTPVSGAPISDAQVLAIPAVRKMARDLGIDLGKVQGTGPDGRILAEDLKGSLAAPTAKISKREDDEETPVVGIRHQMAIRMAESHATIPHFSYFEQADATRLIQLKERLKGDATQEGIRLTFMPLLIRALSLTLQQYPQVNSSYDAGSNKLMLHKHHHIGIAFSTPQGLIVPVMKDVQDLALPDLIRQFETLKQKALEGKLQPADMRDATITISNYGVLGGKGLFATPIIHSPQVAILAVAKIHKQPIVKHDQVVACDLLNLSWSFDHRVIDGEQAAVFSNHYCSLIQNPAALF
ncbi:MAG: 2-oxo acid dehydrogenase subunit E2 [Parachlamydia sp.]|nr:2-oxo acid dehydrogenase subunit E2 [Parachlamydia sp.]